MAKRGLADFRRDLNWQAEYLGEAYSLIETEERDWDTFVRDGKGGMMVILYDSNLDIIEEEYNSIRTFISK